MPGPRCTLAVLAVALAHAERLSVYRVGNRTAQAPTCYLHVRHIRTPSCHEAFRVGEADQQSRPHAGDAKGRSIAALGPAAQRWGRVVVLQCSSEERFTNGDQIS